MTEDISIKHKQEDSPQKKKKKTNIFKKLLKIFLGVILSFIGLNIVLYVLLSIPWVQQQLVNFVIDKLKPTIKTEVSIREVRINLFNEIDLKGVYIEDQAKDTLLYADNLNARFDLWRLIKDNTLLIKGINLSDASVNVSQKTPDDPFNFQFLIDAFAGDSTKQDTTSSTLKIDIQDIIIKNTRLRYDVWSVPDSTNLFNASHIHISHLDANISLPSIDTKNFRGEVKKLSFKEKSGLEVKNITTTILSKGDEFYTNGLVLNTPNSELNIESGKYNLATDEFSLLSHRIKLEAKDFTAFLPNLKFLSAPLLLNASIHGKLPTINIDSLGIDYREKQILRASAFISDYSKYNEADIKLAIKSLAISTKEITDFAKIGDSAFVAPDILNSIGDIRFKGDLSGRLDKLKIEAEAMTKQGGLTLSATGSVDTTFQNFAANIVLHTQNFNLRPFVGDSLGIGRLTASVSAKLRQTTKQSLSIDANGAVEALQYKENTLRNIPFTANYSDAKMGASLNANLSIGSIDGEVQMIRTKTPKYIFDLKVKDFCVGEIYKMENWNDPSISFNLKGDLQGMDINTLLGNVILDSLQFSDASFHFQPGIITLQAGENNVGRYIALRSSICDANLSGKYNFLSLYDEFSITMHPFFPNIIDLPKKKKPIVNDFNLDAFIDNTEDVAKILDLPFVLYKPLQVHLDVNSNNGKISGFANAPDFKYGDMAFKDTNLEINCDTTFNMNASSKYIQEQGSFDFNANIEAQSDTLQTLISMKNSGQDFSIDGSIKALANFERDEHKNLITKLDLLPTKINAGNLQFSVLPAKIKYEDSKIFIENFGLSLKEHNLLLVNGVASDNKEDNLNIFFDRTQIGNILEAFDVKNIDATINGDIVVNAALGKPEIYTKNFVMSDIVVFGDSLGTLNVNTSWSGEENAINLDLSLANPADGTNSTIKGLYYVNTDALDMNINIDRFSLDWMQPFMAGMLNKLSGTISSNLAIKGTTAAPIAEGWLGLNDATFGVDYTNVNYHITDTIKVSPDRIGFDYLILSDDSGNYGLASATITHHNFKDMQYKLNMHLYNLMVLNTESRTDSLFYGKVFASGDVNIIGNDKGIDIDMKVMNSRNSNINILLPQTSSASEYNSIVYINTPESEKTVKKEPEETLPINIKVGLTIDPRINFRVVINPLTGDEMIVNGSGQIDFTYDLKSERMTTFGKYNISNGAVKYRLQQLKTLDFQIQEGSELTFIGDPLQTRFNIAAYQRIRNADLSTLDQSFGSDITLSSTKTDVDCILNIKGNINRMDLSYNVDLPDASDDVKSRVQSLISTDEQRTRQFASLVALGIFYSGSGAKTNIGDGILTNLASTTLSKGLESLFSNVLGNKWQIGTNISASDSNLSDMDVTVNVSRKFFNDKLKINTNLGYRSEQTSTNENPFIGDFDVEYQLTRNWILKAYNYANDKYYITAATTQGIGIVYTKEAKVIKELFRFFSKKKPNKQDMPSKDEL